MNKANLKNIVSRENEAGKIQKNLLKQRVAFGANPEQVLCSLANWAIELKQAKSVHRFFSSVVDGSGCSQVHPVITPDGECYEYKYNRDM